MKYLIESDLIGKRGHIITDYSIPIGNLIISLKYEDNFNIIIEGELKCFHLREDSYNYYSFTSSKITTSDVILMG